MERNAASLTGAIVMVIAASAESNVPSLALNVTVSVPFTFGFGT